MKKILLIAAFCLFICCKSEKKEQIPISKKIQLSEIKYAKGFTVQKSADFTLLQINSPWQGAEKAFTYALIPKDKMAAITLDSDAYDAIITVPVERLVVTSTTHIPALEALGAIEHLVGFPNTDYISSEVARSRIDQGLIKELGNNEAINTEVVLGLNPELVVGFGIDHKNSAYETLNNSGIPVVYNGDWTEESPLGKAEWIKFFAPFFQKEKEADSIFRAIKTSYVQAVTLAGTAKVQPTVFTGGLYKDVWHVAGGKSWMAHFLKDAKANYIWADTQETGGIALSVESVLEKAKNANYWLNPSMLTSYLEMEKANRHYTQFNAFKNNKVYSNTLTKGATGGLLFYELGPNRPDLVLKDLIHIFHPELLPEHQLFFFKPLE